MHASASMCLCVHVHTHTNAHSPQQNTSWYSIYPSFILEGVSGIDAGREEASSLPRWDLGIKVFVKYGEAKQG